MRSHSRLFRLTTTTAIVGLAFGTLLPEIGFAQSPLPPLPGGPSASSAEAPQTTADPPARVGRLAAMSGQVSFHGPGADHWDNASLNYPVISGASFWTQPAASADIGVAGNRLTMDQSTELDIAALDNHGLTATVPQGQVFLRLPTLAQGETYTITTPRGVVTVTAPGRYEIAAGDVQTPTRISVVEGSAQVSGGNAQGNGTLALAANQTMLITGTSQFEPQVGPLQRDGFLTAQLGRERPQVAAGAVQAPAQVAQMTGGNDLYEYGTWTQTQDYGDVWYPQVAADYVPYRDGHWAFVQPWGWTWIDAAPWGFAPFHYGRWVQIDGRWAWAPDGGVVAGSPGYYEPVYAPALVTFLGIGVGVAAGVALAGGFGGNVGWCPLGWQEPYHPWYHASPNYIRAVNVTSVRDVTRITTVNNLTINNFANRSGATVVPARAMALSQPIGREARPLAPGQFADARPLVGRDPVGPTTATAGVDHRVAQELHLGPPPPGAGPALRPAAPGPAIRAYANTPNVRPGVDGRLPVTTGHAPGPPIEPRGAMLTPNGGPPQNLVREPPHVVTPVGPPRPGFAQPLGRPEIHPPPPPPRMVDLGRPPEPPHIVQSPRPFEPPHVVQQLARPEPPQVVQQVRPPEPPHVVEQFRQPPPPPPPHPMQIARPTPPPASHPVPPPPQGHGPERKQPS